jgi:murein DD-endopeptidase MepM/ murein hydrolase activator NlpD
MTPTNSNARERTKRRVRGSLWLACALAIAAPAWLITTFWLLEGTPAAVIGLAPVAAYVVWRAVSELTDENDVGVSQLDRIWIYVEKYLPNAGVRRIAMRTMKSVAVMAGLAVLALVVFRAAPKQQAPLEAPPAAVQAPTAESEGPIAPRQVSGLFAVKVESYPQLIWPAYGHMQSFYGNGTNPYGIDIAFPGEGDARVQASARGSVVYAGPDICCGYGFTVVVEHEEGWVTTYGHLAVMAVKLDERVKAGDTLGTGGAPDGQRRAVHYQVQRGGTPYDPLQVLPASQMGLPVQPGTNQMCGGDALVLDANSVVNLGLTSQALRRYELDSATVTSTTAGAAEIVPTVKGVLSLALAVPPSSEASHTLQLTLQTPEDRIFFECALSVVMAKEVPLAIEPVRRQAPLITPTPFGGPPTPVPTMTPLPTETPPPVSGTPNAAGPAVRSTRPSPTPWGSVLRTSHTPTPTMTPRATSTPKPGAPKPVATVRPTLIRTPSTPPTQTTFPRNYDVLNPNG